MWIVEILSSVFTIKYFTFVYKGMEHWPMKFCTNVWPRYCLPVGPCFKIS